MTRRVPILLAILLACVLVWAADETKLPDGTSVWPFRFPPQATTVPLLFSASV